MQPESKQEANVRQILEAQLPACEPLLAYTSGTISALTSHRHWVGLTRQRLLVQPVSRSKPAGPPISLYRENLKSLRYVGVLSRKIQVSLPTDKLEVIIQGRGWNKRAKALVEIASQLPAPFWQDYNVATQRSLQQVRAFQQLGFLASAQLQLEESIRANPALSGSKSVIAGRAELNQARQWFRLAALCLFGDIVVSGLVAILLSLLGAASAAFILLGSSVIAFVFDGIIGYSLWQGRARWRTWAIWRAFLGLLVFGGPALLAGELLQFTLQASFSLAIIVLLVERPVRGRQSIATALYGIGYLGGIAYAFAVPLINKLLNAH